jgi:hypothetical protein
MKDAFRWYLGKERLAGRDSRVVSRIRKGGFAAL